MQSTDISLPKALQPIAKTFYQAYRLSGIIKMRFGLRNIPDSDGSDVIDVYISPGNQEAICTMQDDPHSGHLQLLTSMVPAKLLGYQFILQITPIDSEDIHIDVLEVLEPSEALPISGPH